MIPGGRNRPRGLSLIVNNNNNNNNNNNKFLLSIPLRNRPCQTTTGLTCTCPQTKMKNQLTSLGMPFVRTSNPLDVIDFTRRNFVKISHYPNSCTLLGCYRPYTLAENCSTTSDRTSASSSSMILKIWGSIGPNVSNCTDTISTKDFLAEGLKKFHH